MGVVFQAQGLYRLEGKVRGRVADGYGVHMHDRGVLRRMLIRGARPLGHQDRYDDPIVADIFIEDGIITAIGSDLSGLAPQNDGCTVIFRSRPARRGGIREQPLPFARHAAQGRV
jgi:hypothetical protein